MMMIDLVDKIAELKGIQRKEMIEKDILLHLVLSDLSKETFFSENFLFKGGTCLIKNYIGYLRFSEDIDFTWKDQSMFAGETGGQVNRDLSGIIEKTGKILEKITSKRGLDFKWDKEDRDYVELISRGRVCTFKVWYDSILKDRKLLKVQINFVDSLCLRPRKGRLKSLVKGKNPKLEGLFKEYSTYASDVPFEVYNAKEILSEKIRALMTRRAVKARDFVDIFFISKKLKIQPKDVEKCVITKINYALEHYERFRRNFDEKKRLLEKGNLFDWGTEKSLLIAKFNDKEFDRFVDDFTRYLQKLVKKMDGSK